MFPLLIKSYIFKYCWHVYAKTGVSAKNLILVAEKLISERMAVARLGVVSLKDVLLRLLLLPQET